MSHDEDVEIAGDPKAWTWILLLRGGGDWICQAKLKPNGLGDLPESFKVRRVMDLTDVPLKTEAEGAPKTTKRLVPVMAIRKMCAPIGHVYRTGVFGILPLSPAMAALAEAEWAASEALLEELAKKNAEIFKAQEAAREANAKARAEGEAPKLALVKGESEIKEVLESRPPTPEEERLMLATIASRAAAGAKAVKTLGGPG